jgi:arylsulfatase A
MKTNFRILVFITVFSMLAAAAHAAAKPNFIVIFTDDQGYGDLGCFGSPDIHTPNIDRMAAEGMRFTSFYAAPFCGPSRASLMTGCYPPRAGLAFNHSPGAKTGINPDEITVAELLQGQDYATMHIGKWHLGDHPQFLPTRHGFDKFFGIPYSNDMWPYHPNMPLGDNPHPRLVAARKRGSMTGYAGQGREYKSPGPFEVPLPLMENEKTLETNPDQTRLITRFTEKALEFIEENKDDAFFLYLAHPMPHVPLFVSDKYEGKSKRGLYGDVIMEIDWSVGQVLKKLKADGIDDNTLVVFTSDNGPWLAYGIDGGSAGPLREGKGTSFEGGMRVPGIFRWPGKIKAGSRTSAVAANMDLLPTFAELAGATPPTDRVIDGRSLWPLLSGQTDDSPHEAYFYYGGSGRRNPRANLRAVRVDQWKLFVRRGANGQFTATELYNLHEDVSEKFNRLERHPEIASRLLETAQKFNNDLTRNSRPLGRVQ